MNIYCDKFNYVTMHIETTCTSKTYKILIPLIFAVHVSLFLLYPCYV